MTIILGTASWRGWQILWARKRTRGGEGKGKEEKKEDISLINSHCRKIPRVTLKTLFQTGPRCFGARWRSSGSGASWRTAWRASSSKPTLLKFMEVSELLLESSNGSFSLSLSSLKASRQNWFRGPSRSPQNRSWNLPSNPRISPDRTRERDEKERGGVGRGGRGRQQVVASS